MADHGTVSVAAADNVVEVTGYRLAGTTPSSPPPPTTGQIWPRGNR